MIEFRNVSKQYDGVTALSPTNLTIPSGETTVLIGPSGCGKSTVLRLIVGLVRPSSGEIRIEDKLIDASTLLDVRRNMGYVIQEGGLFPHLSAGENVTLLARHIGRTESECTPRLKELCELTQLPESALLRFPAELSGGQRQRVSLMRALMLDPDVLLLDEPLGALDPLVRAKLQTDLKSIFSQLDKTVVLVTHDMAEAAYLGETIVMMNEGRVVQVGTLDDLRDRPSDPFVSHFMSAQRSLVEL